jgi:hypothetical protein
MANDLFRQLDSHVSHGVTLMQHLFENSNELATRKGSLLALKGGVSVLEVNYLPWLSVSKQIDASC